MTSGASARPLRNSGLGPLGAVVHPLRADRPWLGGSVLIAGALVGSMLWRPRPLLLWNASASSTIGLYLVTPSARPRFGEVIVAWAPPAARRLADARRYLPFRVPLVKRVAAVAGHRVCAERDRIFVDGRLAAHRVPRDPSGRPMPWWSGCRRLAPGELFLLTAAMPDAFDGRYFGVTRREEVVGTAMLLWAKRANGASLG